MEQQEKAIAALDLFATSRTGIDVASDQIIEGIRSGDVSPLKALVWCKTMEEIIERVRKETKDNQLTASEKYPGKTFEFAGATLTKAEHGTKYNYAACGDTVWERLNVDTEAAKVKQSERETFLKSLKGPEVVVDQLTGEMVTINPPVKTSVSGLTVKIK